MNPVVDGAVKIPQRYVSGSVNDLVTRYLSVPTRLGPSEVTQQKVRAIIEDFAAGRGDRPVKLLTFEAVDKIIAKKAIKTGTGNKTKGGHHAAVKLRKELIRLFDFAIKSEMITINPARFAEKVRLPKGTPKGGFHTWSEVEIEQFRDRHKLGTRERLAMELILWTDQRRCDVVKMGPGQIVNGRIPVFQEKTGKELWLPVAPQLTEAIEAMPPKETSPDYFLVTTRGQRPIKKESFGNWFKKACKAADLSHCSAHGLRKATLRRMAELEMANKTMKSVSGQTSDKTLSIYLEAANQVKLADSAIGALAAWERGEREAKDNLEKGHLFEADCLGKNSSETNEGLKRSMFQDLIKRNGSLSRIRTYGRSINSRELYR
jgi:integrase